MILDVNQNVAPCRSEVSNYSLARLDLLGKIADPSDAGVAMRAPRSGYMHGTPETPFDPPGPYG